MRHLRNRQWMRTCWLRWNKWNTHLRYITDVARRLTMTLCLKKSMSVSTCSSSSVTISWARTPKLRCWSQTWWITKCQRQKLLLVSSRSIVKNTSEYSYPTRKHLKWPNIWSTETNLYANSCDSLNVWWTWDHYWTLRLSHLQPRRRSVLHESDM